MKKSATLIFAFVFAAAFAEEQTPFIVGDAASGEAKYRQVCIACHGENGNTATAAQPSLAGQHAEYLQAQLRAYRDGSRKNAIMQGLAAPLADDEIADLAVYLSAQKPAVAGAADEALARIGERIYRGGISTRDIPSCAACHSPTGAGIPPLNPRLGGQDSQYTANALRAFQSGERKNAVMNTISARLSEDEISALAEYIAGLHP